MNPYLYWQEELAQPGINSRETDRLDICGFWRATGAETKPDWPVAIWEHAGGLALKVGRAAPVVSGSSQFDDFIGSLWYKCAVVTEKDYRTAIDTGRWADGRMARNMDEAEQHGLAHARVQVQAQEEPATETIVMRHTNIQDGSEVAAGIGHNQPPADNPAEALRIELAGELEQAQALLAKPIETEQAASDAAAWRKRLNAIAKLAGQNKDVEIAPHRAKIAEVEGIWRPIYDEAKSHADALRDHLKPWLDKAAQAELARQATAKAAAAKARAEAEEQRRAAEEAAAQPGIDDKEAEEAKAKQAELEARAKAAEREARAKPVQAGRTGAKVSFRTVTSAKITDWAVAIDTFKNAPALRECVQKLADKAANAGTQLPGYEIVTEQKPV